jgi:molybdate-binding protein
LTKCVECASGYSPQSGGARIEICEELCSTSSVLLAGYLTNEGFVSQEDNLPNCKSKLKINI